jgi:hypothetical protein
MSTTIFTAEPYDPQKARRRRQKIIAALCLLVILGAVGYAFRNWRYEHRVDRFFTLLEQQHYKQAYGLWMADPNWEQHPGRHQSYTFHDFYQDWGPPGDWGPIHSHRIQGSVRVGSGVIVVVQINGRVEPARMWVERKDMSLTWSPQ